MRPLTLTLFTAATLMVAAAAEPAPGDVEFFEKKVRPVLAGRCYACHSAETKPAGGLRVDDRNGLLTGGDSGPAVIPGEPDKSLLLERILHKNPKRRMPKEGDLLTEGEVADLSAWIRAGVAWPAEKIPESYGKPKPNYASLRDRHWALQPVRKPAVPSGMRSKWATTEIDRFILAKLEEKKLQPVRDADRLTLVRRISFDLTGLPPSPAEVDAFLADKSPDAWEKLVDRLLASPRFGERWGRHWLDVARYGESTGPSRNIPYPHAWRYRDYVIDAVNRDIPFDRFLQEQIAGDLLPAASTAERDRLLTATGFLALGPKDVNQRFKERFLMDNVDEKIDTVTRSVLALTVSCARCHDHKFDPVPTTDYYALAGIFTSTEDRAGVRNKMGGAGLDYYDPKLLVTLASWTAPARTAKLIELEAQVAQAKQEWEAIRGTPEGLALGPNGGPKQQPYRLKYERLAGELLALTDPATYGFAVHGVADAKQPADTAVRIRGQAERVGPVVPRGFLTAVRIADAPAINPLSSGRLELAQWLTSTGNPLTARVLANRVWQRLFGQGIVTTVDNFGVTGDRPSHPELLDYLAATVVEDGWSVKRLIRRIVLTRTYRLAGDKSPENFEVDPANRLVWRHTPRRLDAEEIRDAVLFASGKLQLQPPLGSVARELKMIEMRDNGVESRAITAHADAELHRSIYLPLLRGLTPRALEAFDPVTQTLVTGRRESTTVPSQALFLLNSGFVRKQSLALAERLVEQYTDGPGRLRAAWRLTLGREPTEAELVRARKWLDEFDRCCASVPSRPSVPAAVPVAAAVPKTPEIPADPDNVDRTEYRPPEENIQPASSKAAVWMSFVQALYASAGFRFVR